MTTCPSPATLARLGHDAIDEASLAAIELHVEGCPACQVALEERVRNATEAETKAEGRVPDLGRWPAIEGFVIERELGRGGSSVVYQARQSELAGQVAIKVVPSGPDSGARERESWLREARLLSRVPWHPNIVRLLHPGQHNGWLYLVMDLVPGGSLNDRLSAPMPPRAAAEILETIARAVAHIHHVDILHLDIKPSNILLDGPVDGGWEQMIPRLTDFGIAQLSADTGATQTADAGPRGTPKYMAPEQVEGNRAAIGPAADIHGLGATFYHMLTADPPFLAATVFETMKQVKDQEPVKPRTRVKGIPPDLETICLTCLHKDPRRRYGSALALADDLRSWIEGRPIRARPSSLIENAWRWCRRRPAIASLLAILGLTIVVGFLGLLGLWRRAESARAVAEANYQTTSQSRNDFLKVTLKSYNVNQPPAHFTALLETARRQECALRKTHPLEVAIQQRLAMIDRLLGFAYLNQARTKEAEVLFSEAIRLWEAYPPTADLEGGHRELFMSLVAMGDLIRETSDISSNYELLLQWQFKVNNSYLNFIKSEFNIESIVALCDVQRRIANGYNRIGEHRRSTTMLAANLRMLEALPTSEASTPAIAVCKALARAAMPEGSIDFTLFQPAIRLESGSSTIREMLDKALAELTVRQVSWGADYDSTLPTGTPRLGSPESWADQVHSIIRRQCASMGRSPAAVPRIAWWMYPTAFHITGEQRRTGKFAEATRTAQRLNALASRLTLDYPTTPYSYLLTSGAQQQIYKNFYHNHDDRAAEQWLRKSLASALHALSLDPENLDARTTVDDRRRRVEGIEPGPARTDTD